MHFSTDNTELALTLKVSTTQVVEKSVSVNKSLIQDYSHPEDHIPPTEDSQFIFAVDAVVNAPFTNPFGQI